ncbi:hypothetical protein GQX73_g7847 [Xylaria multiplex]|uniref:Protein kinase domain-containing protein n=1 Tax=Xylaria multiplex TaxID=323545 RepID=A0A7C8INL7_9PEZI|nr:hypothetical protein GQX73_g7847 [Xylaria multiplex]
MDYEEQAKLQKKIKYANYGDQTLSRYFEGSDRRFIFEKLLGWGKDGITYLIKRKREYKARSLSPDRLRNPEERQGEEDPRRNQSLSPSAFLGGHPISVRNVGLTAKEFFRGPDKVGDLLAPENLQDRIVLKIDLGAVELSLDPEYQPSDEGSDFDEEEEEDYDDDDDEDGGGGGPKETKCQKEKRLLKMFHGCQHIVDVIEIDNDPLTRTFTTITHGLEAPNWFFEEYLENGSLTKFLERFLAHHVKEHEGNANPPPAQLPNRMLWNIFLCLVKMVVGMTWPGGQSNLYPEKLMVDQPLRSFQHGDIHDGNLMFKSKIDEDFAHSILPGLKLIDFAAGRILKEDDQVRRVDDPGVTEGVVEYVFNSFTPPVESPILASRSRNIFFIGKMMAMLVLPERLDQLAEEIIPERAQSGLLPSSPLLVGATESIAVELLPTSPHRPPAGVDGDLVNLIAACMAAKPEHRPRIHRLEEYVRWSARFRDMGFYRNLNDDENRRRAAHGFLPWESMAPSVGTLEKHLRDATSELYAADPSTVTVNSVRQRAEEQNHLEKGFFVTDDWKARSKALITEFVQGLLTNDPSSSAPEPKVEQDTKKGVKRSSSDELSASPPAKRQKKASPAAKSKKNKPKKESSSSALSELSDSEVEPKKENKKTTKKVIGRKQEESDSELSDLESSEDEPKQKTRAKKPATTQNSKKEESESELSDLASSEDEPKPTKKRGGKSKNLKDSHDDKKGAAAKASTSRLKRKQPAAKKKRTAKRTNVESDGEDEVGVEENVEKNEAEADLKIDDDLAAKDQDRGEDTKLDKTESKATADDSDSSLGKNAKEAPKPKQPASKELTGDELEIKKLQGQLVKCGVRKIWGIELKKYGSDGKAKIRHLRGMLRDVGMDGRFSEAKAREIKERRELMGELEAVNEMNELWGLEGRSGRASRSKAVRKSLKEESDEDKDKDKQRPKVGDDDEDEDEDVKVNSNPRVSKRMADLAFLGSDSESE